MRWKDCEGSQGTESLVCKNEHILYFALADGKKRFQFSDATAIEADIASSMIKAGALTRMDSP